MTEREALKLELEELAVRFSEGWHEGIKIDASDIMLLSNAAEALAQPEQESVGTVQCINGVTIGYLEVMQPVGTKLYTTSSQRKPLTDDMEKQSKRHLGPHRRSAFRDGWRSAEAAHGIKE